MPAIKNVREGTRSPRTAHEIGLKRSYDTMEGNIKQGMSMRESPVSAPLEGKTSCFQGVLCFIQTFCIDVRVSRVILWSRLKEKLDLNLTLLTKSM